MKPSLLITHRRNKRLTEKFGFRENTLFDFHLDTDPYKGLESGKLMAKAWARSLDISIHIKAINTFIYKVIEAYWQNVHNIKPSPNRPLPPLSKKENLVKLDESVIALAGAIGKTTAKIEVIEANFYIGNLYSCILPEEHRSANGVYYTPPSLTKRLIQLSEAAGVKWNVAKILDPACGCGAFLIPIAIKIVKSLKGKSANFVIDHIKNHLLGYEIDEFSAWVAQVFLEVTLKDIIQEANVQPPQLIKVCNSLELPIPLETEKNDLVIGNPPYGKVKLTEVLRSRFKSSLYGHANLYGLFTQLAVEFTKSKGITSLLTPTSFLSGEYFKNLRFLLRTNTQVLEIDFLSIRKGVFEDVLQETMLAVYEKQPCTKKLLCVNQISTIDRNNIQVEEAGCFDLPKGVDSPWILPRTSAQTKYVSAMKNMPYRLADWGYKVSTGPLVWNRHKEQFLEKANKGALPVIWAEAITQDGQFILRSEKKNHKPYFAIKKGEEWLITKRTCIILQRTTAKEQSKRLIAAVIPESLFSKVEGAIIENHLNVIVPTVNMPHVSINTLAAFLNSASVNQAFRTMSGSVAISAYELETFPLPSPTALNNLNILVDKKAPQNLIEQECANIYIL